MAEKKTAIVRVCVAVEANGEWAAFGRSGSPDIEMKRVATDAADQHGTPIKWLWVEAEIELPEKPTAVAGTVVP